ncbi:NhaP-type Na+/H+ or K+/H+ antiporter [Arthrobacter stackebrandtii]|uniref:NhaP-type Na+/H+ or K+/H+ antiporter n=1 Tax=Arthrobacter stackebrandtii TaxID=272161 RepID=A0ABS4Z265_9MICC|nr:hypothetical protein [Arthrobacter stackebrandtii]MBP2414358.1 NhaP-type Na+/H+ or K+/H+ antiporter [Arthrobacter stackebrandtii]PYH01499.1 hypothetical protein CVV67_03185 [Arthrobacter stackebrandtii]
MIIFLIRAAICVGTAALGLLVVSWVLADFNLQVSGFFIAILVFAATHSLHSPFTFRIANRYAPVALGGIGLLSTLTAPLVANLFPEGLQISSATAWVLAPVIVWITTALGAWLLPVIFRKKRLATRAAQKSARLAHK